MRAAPSDETLTRFCVTFIDASFAFPDRDEDREQTLFGGFTVSAEDGTQLAFDIEPLAAAEIGITRTFAPAERSVYRRALVRGRQAGGTPLLGRVEPAGSGIGRSGPREPERGRFPCQMRGLVVVH